MHGPSARRRPIRSAVLALTLLLIAGCAAAPVDRAGGHAARDVRVLTFGQFGVTPGPAVEAWAAQVKVLSNDALRIDFKNEWRAGRADFETATVDDVRNRTVDVAIVGARVFDLAGVTSFHALLAPMLVDSQGLQSKVFAAGVPDQMAEHLEPAGVLSLGTLPGPMRKVLGVSKPLLRPADFRGMVVGIQDSALTQRTFRALGAVPRPVAPAAALSGLDGYEQQLGSVVGNHYVDAAKYVTANLDLWPRPQVIITSPATLASLSTEEQHALRQAIVVARPVAQQTAQKEDNTSAPSLCRDGMSLPAASAEDLQELTAALAPVLDELAAEPGTRPWLEWIRSLKKELAVGADSQTCGGPSAATVGTPTPIPDGTYRRTTITGEAVSGCKPNSEIYPADSYFLLKLKQGSVTLYSPSSTPGARPEVGWVGTYRVFRDRVDFSEASTGGVLSAAWALDGNRLTLSDLEGGACGDANVWIVAPWYKDP